MQATTTPSHNHIQGTVLMYLVLGSLRLRQPRGLPQFFSCGFQATNEKMSTLVSVRQRRHQRRQDQAISRISKLSPFLMLEGTGFCSDDFPTIEKNKWEIKYSILQDTTIKSD